MGDQIKNLEQLGQFIPSYPRPLQYFFYFTIACILISIFLAIYKYPSTSNYNKKLNLLDSISAKTQQIADSNMPMVGVSRYSYVPIRNNRQLKQGVNIDDIDRLMLTVYVKNYGKLPADNYVFSYSIIYGSEEIYKTAQDDVSLSKGTLLMPGQSSFNQIIFDKDMLLKLKSMTPIILKIKLTYTDRSGNYKDEVPYTILVNRINNPFVLKLTSLPH